MVIWVLHPSPVPCRWGPAADRGPGGILHCCSWVKTSCSSQGTRKVPPTRCSGGFWRRLLLCSIAQPAGNPGWQPEGLTWLAKSPRTGHMQSHAALPGLGRERGEQQCILSLRLLVPGWRELGLCPLEMDLSLSPSHRQQCEAAGQFPLALVGDLVQGMGAARRDRCPLCPCCCWREDLKRDPSHTSWLGSAEQPLLGEILLLFLDADATNGCGTTASVGAVTHPASLGTSRSQRLCPRGKETVCSSCSDPGCSSDRAR